jgi:hypothetical protein
MEKLGALATHSLDKLCKEQQLGRPHPPLFLFWQSKLLFLLNPQLQIPEVMFTGKTGCRVCRVLYIGPNTTYPLLPLVQMIL